MKSLYARCMDGHYFRASDGPYCPLDGSMAPSAEVGRQVAAGLSGELSLGALVTAGLPADLLQDLAVFETGDESPTPEMLHPFLDDEREPR